MEEDNEDSAVIGNDEATADSLEALGITALKYSVENVAMGTVPVPVFSVNAPNCGDTDVMTVSRDLGELESKFFTYSIKDQNDNKIWSGDVFISSIVCSTLQVFF